MILKEIGRGMHGKVKLAQDLDTGELVIVDKQSRRRQLGYSALRAKSTGQDSTPYMESEQKIRREIAILKKCIHPHVVRLREVIDDPASRKIYLALEYMEGGEIIWREDEESSTPVLTKEESRQIFRDVVSGLDYLHYQGIIHRDIKPANLLLTRDGIVKISDFGVSYFNPQLAGGTSLEAYNDEIDRELAETAGTPAFFAPELCSSVENNNVDDKRITKAIDVWALGVTLYCLIFGQCPFTASTEFELFDIIPTQPLVFPSTTENIPTELIDLLNKLLEKDPNQRITLDQVKHHPWVIQDLADPAAWWRESDPRLYKTVYVTDDDLSRAVTLMDKLRKSIHRISSSLSHTFSRHASKSSLPDINTSPTTSIISHPQPTTTTTTTTTTMRDNNGWLPTSFTPSTCSTSSKESIHDEDEDKRSSGSSMSGLLVTFNHASSEQ
ncbi:hypothetical protein MFLAVUS_004776 [Mucor flavus]|uniref:Protein kinase domain-containing protein n=1 Tax=Mucor flavus TaxID=439312 RepID=A0ABP9YWV8_9FUNG